MHEEGSFVMLAGEIGLDCERFLMAKYPTLIGLGMCYYFKPSASAAAQKLFKQSSSDILAVTFEH